MELHLSVSQTMGQTSGAWQSLTEAGNYTPPPCSFNRVVINLTVTSSGRQFDRLALMYLGDTEVFRTSTAEPTANGIIWNYMKEMQMYNALWKQPQKLIFDLGNLINNIYTGSYATTLTATFFTIPDGPATADVVLPISSRASVNNTGSVFQVPDQNASVGYSFPNSVNRAVVSLAAVGQIGEEFWYSNVPNSDVDTFPDTAGALPGNGTFREVQLLIDGQLAGVSWPFPVIFTGGIVPGFWRPIVAMDAFDLKQAEIDITPWLGYLLDGGNHVFEIRVAAVNDDGHNLATLSEAPGEYWLVSGSIFLFKDSKGRATTGSKPTINITPVDLNFSSSFTQISNGTNHTLLNNTLTYSTKATRSISISSTLEIGGRSEQVSWNQELSYSNNNRLTDFGFVQLTDQLTEGTDEATGPWAFSHSYNYPLTVNSSFTTTNNGNNLFLSGQISHGKLFTTMGNPVFPSGLQNFNTSTMTGSPCSYSLSGSQEQQLAAGAVSGFLDGKRLLGTTLNTKQVGTAQYQSIGNVSSSFGTTEQWFSFIGLGEDGDGVNAELYNRHVKAVNSTVVEDDQTFIGRNFATLDGQGQGAGGYMTVQANSGGGVRQFIGRGYGKSGRNIP